MTAEGKSVAQGDREEKSQAILIDRSIPRSAEFTGLLSRSGYRAIRTGFPSTLDELLRQEKPDLVVLSRRSIEGQPGLSSGSKTVATRATPTPTVRPWGTV